MICFINLFCAGLGEVKRIGLVYFLYLFFFSGLEFTLTFLTHSVFKYTRSVSQYIAISHIFSVRLCYAVFVICRNPGAIPLSLT